MSLNKFSIMSFVYKLAPKKISGLIIIIVEGLMTHNVLIAIDHT